MNPHTRFRLIFSAAFGVAIATAVAAQNPPAAPAPAGNPPPQQGGAGTPGQIAIPQPCTPEEIAAAQAATAGQAPEPVAGRGRGGRGGVPCHMPDPREGLKAGLYDAGQAALNMTLVASMRQPEGMYDPNPSPGGRSLDYANSDLAFGADGKLALQGSFHGLIFYDVETRRR
jgi:hypothetical protein